MQIKIYTKFCVKCIRPLELEAMQKWALENTGHPIEVLRTTYRPALHQEAAILWGEDNYTSFVTIEGNNIDFDEFYKRIKEGAKMQDFLIYGEPKFVSKTKKKPVKKVKAKKEANNE